MSVNGGSVLDMSLEAWWEVWQFIRAVLPVIAYSRISAVFPEHLVICFSKDEATRASMRSL